MKMLAQKPTTAVETAAAVPAFGQLPDPNKPSTDGEKQKAAALCELAVCKWNCSLHNANDLAPPSLK